MSHISIKIASIQNYSYDLTQHVEAEQLKHHPTERTAAAQRHDRLK